MNKNCSNSEKSLIYGITYVFGIHKHEQIQSLKLLLLLVLTTETL